MFELEFAASLVQLHRATSSYTARLAPFGALASDPDKWGVGQVRNHGDKLRE
jgi:hypothetical protein